MELHQLRYFVAVVREGTFTKAAETLYITQPSLSEQIRKLETELGSPLFQRLGRKLALTSAGESFLPHAQKVMFEVEQARARVQEVRGLRRGRLSIGVLPSAAARLLPRFLAEFRRQHPGVEVSLREENASAEFEQLVHDGLLDLAIVRLPIRRRTDLDVEFLVREPMVMVAPPGHRLADRRSVALAELANEPFVTMKPGHGLRESLLRFCRQAGFDPHIVFEANHLGSVMGLVLAGLGITVLPRMAAGHEGRRVRVRDGFAFRDLGVIWRQGQPLSPAARIFLDMMRRSANREDREGPSGARSATADAGVSIMRRPE
ncbi:MAG TPA: LysR substrate-binding domain-containing protein [Terriglobales bacterium]|nr:LysR substrate-binding domain-containing protein [Terriglobales bacterium]